MLDLNQAISSARIRKATFASGAAIASLRELAIRAAQATSQQLSLIELWVELVEGRCRVVDDFFDECRCYAIVHATAPGTSRPLRAREREFLERCLLGDGEKVVALEHGLSTSTVASRLSQVMQRLGFEVQPPRAPLIATMAAYASRAGAPLSAEMANVHIELPGLRVVWAQRPEPRPRCLLSAAERAVLALLSEGLSNTEIAARRHRSPRTVANQVASLFQKFGTSGRRPLVALLVSGSRHRESLTTIDDCEEA